MPRKSNKTSYVMNLITNGEEEQGQESQSGQDSRNEQEAQSGQTAQNGQGVQAAAVNDGQSIQTAGQTAAAAQTLVSGAAPEAEIKKVVVVDEDQESERLSEEIRGQLELELEAELKEQADTAEREPEQLSQGAGQFSQEPGQSSQEAGQSVQEPEQSSQTTEAVKQEATENAAAKTETEAAASADTAAIKTEIAEPTMDTEMNTGTETMDAAAETSNTTTQPTQPTQPGYRMVNVMETLVARVNLDKYIKEYGVCPCPRCRADVHALILTSLPSKYVVMDENAISLMLNFYESRRKTDIFTATLKACLEVKEHPRHEGAEGQ